MKILVACEFSGIVREAFRAKGHDAWSCDLVDTEIPGPHIIGDVRLILDQGWDMMICHPECTFLCRSGERWLKGNPERQLKRKEAIDFALMLWCANIPKICLENPIGTLSGILGPKQIIQPWQFGDPTSKATCLWLKGLPPLFHTHIMAERAPKVHYAAPGKERKRFRSRTSQGIAQAMAEQWG